ncbi:hypothetical protein D3C72_1143130 [compost metagenome]
MEAVGHAGQQEEHRTQAEHREHVGGQHDERVGGDREDRRDAVHREDHVGHCDQDQHREQRGEPAHAVALDAHRVAFVVRQQAQVLAHPAQGRVGFQVRLLARGEPHLPAGEEQEGAEYVEQPMELGDQHATGEDHDRTQHDRAQDADDQHLLALFLRHREVAHDHQEDKDVVHRQRLLDQVAGQELQADLVGHDLAGRLVQVEPEAAVEGQRQRDPADGPPQGLLEGDLVRATMAHQYEVDQQGDDHHRCEAAPQPQITDRLHGFVRWENEKCLKPDGEDLQRRIGGIRGQSFAIRRRSRSQPRWVGLPLHRSLRARIDGDNVWELLPFCGRFCGLAGPASIARAFSGFPASAAPRLQ